ncbi:MAG: hypothetical protein WC980_09555 [Candidatus Brocadiia bacterium]
MADKKLKIYYCNESHEVKIIGNKEGLEFLSDGLKKIIGKKGPGANRLSLLPGDQLVDGSAPVMTLFSDNNEDYEEED